MDKFDVHWGNSPLKLRSNSRPKKLILNQENENCLVRKSEETVDHDKSYILGWWKTEKYAAELGEKELKSKADFAEEENINYLLERIKSLQS